MLNSVCNQEVKIEQCLAKREFCVCKIISQHPLFKNIPQDETHRVNSFSSVRQYKAMENIFFSDTSSDYIYFVLQGMVRLYSEDSQTNKEYIHRICIAGSALNAETLLSNKQVKQSIAQCLDDSIVLIIEKRSLQKYVEDNLVVALNLITFLSDSIVDIDNRARSFVLEELNERIMHFLKQEAGKNNSANVKLTIPKAELAHYLGTIPSTLSKALAKLENQNLIKMNKNLIELL